MQKKDGYQMGEPFFIEAAIDERGPKSLKVVKSFNQYLVYDEQHMLSCIQLNDDGDWEQVDGDLTGGIIQVLGQSIQRQNAL